MGYTWPLPADIPISQHFGDNPNNGVNPSGGHTGTDFAAPTGTPVRAPGPGVIKHADYFTGSYDGNPWWLTPMGGITVVLDCGDTEPTFVFAHLSRTDLTEGQTVNQGDVIGYTGDTGTATTGPHLHFEALPPGYVLNSPTYGRVDPATYCSGYWSGISAQGGNITPIQEDTMTPEQEAKLDQTLALLGYVAGEKFKVDIFTGASQTELDARAQFITDIYTRDFARQGGPGGTVNLGAVVANFDSGVSNIVNTVNAHIDEALKGISLTITDAQVQAIANTLIAQLPEADLALLKSKL